MKYSKVLLIIICIVTPMFYIASQFIRNYVAIMLILFLYSVLLSYLVVFKRLQYLLLLWVLWHFSNWIAYYFILTPSWVLANGDLIVMSRVSEEICAKGHYPFNNEYLVSTRPNYVFYPTSFMLQAILSIVTSINVRTLMYVPVLMYATYFLVLILTLLLLKEVPSELSLFAVIPILSFLAPPTTYFVYSFVTRAFLFMFLFISIKLFFDRSTKQKVGASIFALILLAISSVVGHSQEPITFSIFLALFITLVVFMEYSARNFSNYSSILLILWFMFLSLVLAYNIYIGTSLFQGIASLLERLLMALLPEASLEVVFQKSSIAQSVLSREELITVMVGFIASMIYVAIFLLRHLIDAVRNKKWFEIAFDLAILLLGVIAILPLMMPGIGTDLFWRPLWTLFIALALWPLAVSYKRKVNDRQTNLRLILIIIIALFAFSNKIYMRWHLISSSVYTHEASTIASIVKSSLLRYLQTTEPVKVVLVDSPYQPAYEIDRALIYLVPETRVETVTLALQPEVRWYVNLSYLNGLAKLRVYNTKYYDRANNIHDAYVFTSLYDIPLIPAILISKNVVFSFRDIVVFL